MACQSPVAMKDLVRKLHWEGVPYEEIARQVGCCERTVSRIIQAAPWRPRSRGERKLAVAEREEISRGLQAGESYRSIARRLKRAASTISREVNAQGKHRYRAW